MGTGPRPPSMGGRPSRGADERPALHGSMVKRVLLASPRGLLRRGRTGRRHRRASSSTCTGRPSTCASRSSTTRTSYATSRRAARSSSRTSARCREGETVVLSAHGVAPAVLRERRGARAEHDRRDLPARDEGARPGSPVRGRRIHGPADRPRGARGGRRDDGRGAGLDDPRPVGRRRGRSGAAGRREGRLHHADDALRRRDRRDHHRASPALPADPRAEEGRHLLRDLQPAVGREGSARRGRPPARHRLAQLVELEPARRGGPRERRRGAPDRRRDATSTRRGSTPSRPSG